MTAPRLKKSYAAAVVAALSLAAGCTNLQVRAGIRPDPRLLETEMTLGQSSSADVRRVLGEPFGTGKEMLPISSTPRDMWSYYYELGNLEDSRRIFLFVYFDKDRYDGYMWFSSLRD